MCNHDFELDKITGNEPTTIDPFQCPICDDVDDNGLEACAACYMAELAKVATLRETLEAEQAAHDATQRDLIEARESMNRLIIQKRRDLIEAKEAMTRLINKKDAG